MSDQNGSSRRDFLKTGAAIIAGAGLAQEGCATLDFSGKPHTGPVPRHDVVIIGSGFGATVAARELTRDTGSRKFDVLMLERGVFFNSPERPVPDFLKGSPSNWYQYWPTPDSGDGLRRAFLPLVHISKDSRVRAREGRVPLYRYSRFDHVDVVSAIGVGGGSLIYSNVSLEPYRQSDGTYPILKDWPLPLDASAFTLAKDWMRRRRGSTVEIVTSAPVGKGLQGDLKDLGAKGYEYLYLARSNAFRRAAAKVQGSWKVLKSWEPLPLQLAEHDVTDPKTLIGARFCERKGRCFMGCLPGARHTLHKTLFPELSMEYEKRQLRIRPMSDIRQIRRVVVNSEPGYEVIFHDVLTGDEHRVWAPVVILAAGVIGTTEILLRSRDLPIKDTRPLPLSDRLGYNFSTNGDFSGFVRGIPREVTVSGKTFDNRVFPTRGPINTSHFSVEFDGKQINVEDAGIPQMFAAMARTIVNATSQGGKINLGRLIREWTDSDRKTLNEDQMVEDLFWFNCMGDDRTDGIPGGVFSLDSRGRLQLSYPKGPPTSHPIFGRTEELLKAFATQMGGSYVPFPAWGGTFGGRKLVVTHPLGGCPMGNTASDGTVDREGRVFSSKTGDAVHAGLYVMDGSVIPGPVAVNPSLTIVAVALKVVASVRAYLGLQP